ncbi:unnamed protein product [Coffea canephora]|uniref:Uncharacterized protein n=1 Tax=Coffea canephora TaxID=49390 RepID=A0A068U218_COFCA|nr:unnamed protein product [Coffea canephora]
MPITRLPQQQKNFRKRNPQPHDFHDQGSLLSSLYVTVLTRIIKTIPHDFGHFSSQTDESGFIIVFIWTVNI